ncbi:acyl-CoA dehydrogenase family protein [Pseudonocardia acidicola]|uniref:Acyl-CoA/acyl-ACP dehydrogenase n=1 Tax=Pseudonocardia acidicola TaxID=2724939 RepID=A0ABX1SET9_9PSEU|nr:acyl-CoA dehydrogenase family protein [Pseudonocardia acidicola]NMH98698.1 acyl-CoA/acyl-ACP dehydrogenase [Pseudonocardia acidicola]
MSLVAAELPVAEIRGFFGPRAAAVDRCEVDVRDGLRFLAERGLLGHPELRVSFELIRLVARSDLASAFSLWAHTMVVQCVAASPSPRMRATADQLRRATVWGSTAMAPAIKHMAGLGELPVTFRRDGDILVLDGRIPWASNLFGRDLVVALAARGEDGERLVLAVTGENPGLSLGGPQDLLAMSATASSDLVLRGARVEPQAVISTDFVGYLKAMKPRLLILQTAFCLGLAAEALTAAEAWPARTMAGYHDDHAALAQQFADLDQRAAALVEALAPVREVVQTRLQAGRLAQAAVELELRIAGGAGFAAGSPTARRYREAAFLPVQTPTEGQLQAELR